LRRLFLFLAAVLAVSPIAEAASRGYLTTPDELAAIKRQAAAGAEPYRSAFRDALEYASHATLPAPDQGRVACAASRQPAYATFGSPMAYGFALAWQLTGDRLWADKTRGAIRKLQLVTGLAAGDCPLTMGRHIPDWIRAADLIENYWSSDEKRAFQNWLAAIVYPSLATKYRRGNNWGAVITNAGQYIADYLNDRPDLKLDGLSPAEAYRLMRQTALDRVNGVIWDQCGQGVSMIRPDGGIPEELRRTPDAGCAATQLGMDTPGHHYSEGYLAGTISQAELCLRRGDTALYENLNLQKGGSIRKAIDFVLDRVPWEKKPSLMIAARYYRDVRMLAAARQVNSQGSESHDYVNHFTRLTHDFAIGAAPLPPPVTRPPQ
jgi:hypothetical protein